MELADSFDVCLSSGMRLIRREFDFSWIQKPQTHTQCHAHSTSTTSFISFVFFHIVSWNVCFELSSIRCCCRCCCWVSEIFWCAISKPEFWPLSPSANTCCLAHKLSKCVSLLLLEYQWIPFEKRKADERISEWGFWMRQIKLIHAPFNLYSMSTKLPNNLGSCGVR